MNLAEWTMTRTADGDYLIRRGERLFGSILKVAGGGGAAFQFMSAVRRHGKPKKPQATVAQALRKSSQFSAALVHHLVITQKDLVP